MRTLEDIDAVLEGEYRLKYVRGLFERYADSKVPDAHKNWKGVWDIAYDTLIKFHNVRIPQVGAGVSDLPALYYFCMCYKEMFDTLPKCNHECRTHLDDVLITLDTIKSLDMLTPFCKSNENHYALNAHLRIGDVVQRSIEEGHPSIAELEASTIATWNGERKRSGKRPLAALEEQDIVNTTCEGRGDITARQLYRYGDQGSAAYFVLRESPDSGSNGQELIAWAADKEVGTSDVLVAALLNTLRKKAIRRVKNSLEETHPVS